MATQIPLVDNSHKHPYSVRRFRSALTRFLGGRAVQASARAVLVLVLVRVLPVADYGAYMLLVGLSETVLQLVSFGLSPVGYRYLPEFITTLPYLKLRNFVAGITAMQIAILCVLAFVLTNTWNKVMPLMGFSAEQLEQTAIGVWLFLLVPAFRFCADLLEALLEQGKAQVARALMPTGRVLILGVILLLTDGVSLRGVLIIDIAVTSLCLLLAWFFMYRSLRDLHRPDADGQMPVKEMFRFGWHMAGVNLLSSTGSPGAIRAVLANSLGVVETGLFAFLQSLQRLVGRYLPGVFLRGLIRPVLVARATQANGMAIVQAGTGLLFKLNLLVVSVSSIIIAVGGDRLVEILSGGKFSDAGFILLLMFLGLAVVAQRSVIEMAMQITGQTSALRGTALLAPIALLAVWLLSKHGLEVAVLIIVAFSSLANGIAVVLLRRGPHNFSVDLHGQAVIAIAAAIAILVSIGLTNAMSPVVAGIIASCLFLVAMLIGKPFTAAESTLVGKVAGQRAASLMKRLFVRR